MAPTADEEKDLSRALEQDNVEERDLEKNDSSSQFLQVPSHPGKLGRTRSDASTTLSRIESTATELTQTSTAIPVKTTEAEQLPWYHKINPLKRGPVPPVPEERAVCPEYNAGFFSLLTFQWMQPLMSVGYKRTIE